MTSSFFIRIFLIISFPLLSVIAATQDVHPFFSVQTQVEKLVLDLVYPREQPIKFDNPLVNKTVPEVIRHYGYPEESHTVETDDGYLLTIHRIPHGLKNSTRSQPRTPVLLVHGVLDSSEIWVCQPPDRGVAFLLADAGYDVFMANLRGNYYSRRHTKYRTAGTFWEFNIETIANNDLPSLIDYALNVTGKASLQYVGHSMGTSVLYMMLSNKPEYNDKVSLFVAIGSAGYIKDMTTPFKYVIPWASFLEPLIRILNVQEILPRGVYSPLIQPGEIQHSKVVYNTFKYFLLNPGEYLINERRFPMFVSSFPSGTSYQVILHFCQLYTSGRYQKYDYGKISNYYHYRTTIAPEFEVERISAPVVFVWSDKDVFVSENDVNRILPKLRSLVREIKIENREFSHIDYFWSSSAKEIVWEDILGEMEKYRSK